MGPMFSMPSFDRLVKNHPTVNLQALIIARPEKGQIAEQLKENEKQQSLEPGRQI
jgi:hypothetical protein